MVGGRSSASERQTTAVATDAVGEQAREAGKRLNRALQVRLGRIHDVGRVRQASKATSRAIAATTLPKISKVVGSATCATTTPARTAGSEREV
jgi:hypothetical protein